MPIVGFLEGFNEQQKADADLERTQAATQQSVLESQARMQDLKDRTATRSVLSDLASQPQGASGLSDQYRNAAQQVMGINPELSVKLSNQASLMDDRAAQETQRKGAVEGQRLQREAGFLGSLIDNPAAYQASMLQHIANGNKAPPWYTGNYEVDAPYLKAEANAALTREQQVSNDVKQARQEGIAAKLEEATRNHDLRNQVALKDTENARLKADNLQAWRESEQARKEREFAQKQENITKKQSLIPGEKERLIAMDLVKSDKVLKTLSDPMKLAAANELAAMAKKSLAQSETSDPEDYQDYLDDAAEEIKKRVKPGTTFGIATPWDKATLAPREAEGKKPEQAKPSTAMGTKDNPHLPQTPADFAKVKSKEVYRHPDDGKLYIKP